MQLLNPFPRDKKIFPLNLYCYIRAGTLLVAAAEDFAKEKSEITATLQHRASGMVYLSKLFEIEMLSFGFAF